jgi:hypothetical protein
VALLIVDHHMTEMPGLEFLARAHELHPAAKRVLLVERDYSARSPVVQAMTLEPTPARIVEAVGGTTHRGISQCDVAIVGAGAAGLAAAVYAASEGLQTVVLEETVSGGQAGSSPMIRNYPGFAHGISGHDLTRQACEQAWIFGAHMVFSQPVAGLSCRGRDRVVHLADGQDITAQAVITERSYSIASASGGIRIELTIQRLYDGEVSPYLTEVLTPGNPLELRGPIGGYFAWHPEDPQPVLLIGIAMSLVQRRVSP